MQITIKDKVYDLSWGMGAIEIYCDNMECDIEGLIHIQDATNPLRMQKALTVLVQAALQNAKEIAGEKLELTYRQLQAHLSEIEQDKFKEIIDDFVKSKYLGKTVGEHIFGVVPDGEEDKKKDLVSD